MFSQQDAEPHYTQYMFNRMIINPATTGLRQGWDLAAFYRNQWAQMPGAPVNELITIQHGMKSQKMGFGGFIMNDKIGLENRVNTFFSGAYHIRAEKQTISMGLQIGLRTFFLNASDLDPKDKGDAALSSGYRMPVTPDFTFGFNYTYENLYAGFSISHLNQSKFRYANKLDQSNLRRHLYFNVGYNYIIDPVYTLKPSIMFRYTAKAPAMADISTVLDISKKYWFGLNYRTKDALGIILGVNLDNLDVIKYDIKVGYAYDYTLNKFNRRLGGTHEIMLTYIPKKIVKHHTPKFQRLEF